MSSLKFEINPFRELLFREMMVIFDNFNSISPWITDLAAPPEPKINELFFTKLSLFKG